MKPKVGFLRYLLVASFVVAFAAENKRAMVVNVGVVLDLNSLVGKMALSCINASLYDFYASHPHHTTTILLHIRHSKADAVGAAAQGPLSLTTKILLCYCLLLNLIFLRKTKKRTNSC